MKAMKTHSPVVAMASNDSEPLPLGWEVKIDPQTGWPFFVDHNNRRTTWNDPRHDTKKVREVSANGPNIPPEPSPQDTQKTFVREMKHPILRPGYVPIPVFHDGTELRQQQQQHQQHPCYSYIQPAAVQNIRTEERTPSPTPSRHCRPRSPLHTPSESSFTEPVGSPVTQTTEVHTVPHQQPSRPSSTSLQAGYIPIPVIHESGGGQVQPQLNPSVYSQRVSYPEHHQPYHRHQSDEWPGYSPGMQPPRERASPVVFPQHRDASSFHHTPHIKNQHPIMTQVMGERPQVQHNVLMREPPQMIEQEQQNMQQKPNNKPPSPSLYPEPDMPQQPHHFQQPPPQQPHHFQQPPPQPPHHFQQPPPQPPQMFPQPLLQHAQSFQPLSPQQSQPFQHPQPFTQPPPQQTKPSQQPPPQQSQAFPQPPPQHQHYNQQQELQHPQHFQPISSPAVSPQPQHPELSEPQFPPPPKAEQSQAHVEDIPVQMSPEPESPEIITDPSEDQNVKVEAESSPSVHPGLMKVQQIVERVSRLEQEVKCFNGRKNDKKYLLLEELLTKELLALDTVDPEGRVDVRQARRDGVRRVQTILEELEQLEENPYPLPVEEGENMSKKGDPSMITKQNVEITKEIS